MTRQKEQKQSQGGPSLRGFLRENALNWLLVLVPVSWAVALLGLPLPLLFLTSALAIISLAGLTGQATEEVANQVSTGVAGLLSASFGSVDLLIIGLVGLRSGLVEVVKASITGGIISTILLVLGSSIVAGGWRRSRQVFNRTTAGASAAMLFLAAVALVMPGALALGAFGARQPTPLSIEELSLLVAAVLLAIYVGSLVFSLRTHRALYAAAGPPPHKPRLGLRQAAGLLFVAVTVTALEADLLVMAISAVTAGLHLTEFFVGVILVGAIGSAGEYYTAVLVAQQNRMGLAMNLAISSATQIALFIAPVLIFVSALLGRPMSLVFNPFEIAGVAISVLILAIVSLDGETNWFEGLQLVAVYLILAIVFFFVPAPR